MVRGDIIHNEDELPALPAALWHVVERPHPHRVKYYFESVKDTPVGKVATVWDYYKSGRKYNRREVALRLLFFEGCFTTKPHLATEVIYNLIQQKGDR